MITSPVRMLRHLRPKRITKVGCGSSCALALDTIDRSFPASGRAAWSSNPLPTIFTRCSGRPGRNYSWNEVYALRAFLTCKRHWEILFFNDYFARTERERVRVAAPEILAKPGGGLWLRRR